MRRRNPTPRDEHHREMLLRPPDRTFRQKVRDIFWDSKNKTCLTRTPLNWFTITVYYVIFIFCILFIFVGIMFLVYFKLNVGKPQYILNESPIGRSPSLNYFPMDSTRSLIWLSPSRSYDPYVQSITKIFDDYKHANGSFDPSKYGECGTAPFGYDNMTPCIFFRLNRVILWKPDPYESGDDLPSNVPEELKELVSGGDQKIWVFCQGSSAKDRDHILPSFFNYQTPQGFDTKDFPFNMQKSFVDPIVAIKINAENHTKVLFSFTCSAWGRKIESKFTEVDVNFYFEE